MNTNKTAIIIPSRIGSTRLESKPLQMIGEYPMIYHVVKRALNSEAGEVIVATDSEEIAEISRNAGAIAIITGDAKTGTDRIYKALIELEKEGGSFDYVINLQGDLPLISPEIIIDIANMLEESDADIVTPVNKEAADVENNPARVKAVMDKNGKALYFSRNMIPCDQAWYWHHIGIYGFKRDSLKSFVELPQSPLEKIEKLEQLRALENGMEIRLLEVGLSVMSVDTKEDLDLARNLYTKNPQIV